MTNKRVDHMISSDSFAFNNGNDTKNDFDLLATRSFTRPVFLDLGGASNPFWKRGLKVPNVKPELLPFNSFTRWIISQVLASGLRTKYQFTSPDDDRIGSIWNRNKEEEMLKKVEMGKNPEECLTEMSKNRKMQDGLRSKMM